MIKKVGKVGVYIRDQQRALEFYRDKLSFEVRADIPMGPDARWIEVAPPGEDTALSLFTPPGLEDRIGTFGGIVFECEDVNATYEELKRKGVEFSEPPTDQPGGVMATFQDADGNSFVLRGLD